MTEPELLDGDESHAVIEWFKAELDGYPSRMHRERAEHIVEGILETHQISLTIVLGDRLDDATRVLCLLAHRYKVEK